MSMLRFVLTRALDFVLLVKSGNDIKMMRK